jgi:hypothetical protein
MAAHVPEARGEPNLDPARDVSVGRIAYGLFLMLYLAGRALCQIDARFRQVSGCGRGKAISNDGDHRSTCFDTIGVRAEDY